jgi:hypothetical protein
MSALKHFKEQVRKELPKAEEWVITYAAKVRLRSWIESKFTKSSDLKEAFKYFMNEEDQHGAFTEGKASMFPIDNGGYSSPYQEMVEADTAAFYEAVKSTVGAVANRVQEAMIVVCFGEQVTATI